MANARSALHTPRLPVSIVALGDSGEALLLREILESLFTWGHLRLRLPLWQRCKGLRSVISCLA